MTRPREPEHPAPKAADGIFSHVNSILAAGRADLCALARPHLANPNWTLHAAAELHYDGVAWPNPYLTGKEQLQRLTERARQMAQII